MSMPYGSVEAGGTKCICAVGTGPHDLRNIESFPTAEPSETLRAVISYFKKHGPVRAVGISSFGPLDLHKDSPTYGRITTTPKPHWQHVDIAGEIARALGVPVALDTDVNGAALAEGAWGAAQGLDTFIYITVGTGLGLGVIANGKPLHGLVHPEGGHILLPLRSDDRQGGSCPYHGSCLEGLVCGPAIEKRCGMRGVDIPDAHPVWDLVAHYLALGLANFICTVSPQKIIIGGGIMTKRPFVLPAIRKKTAAALAGYVASEAITKHIDSYIVLPALEHCGVLGGIVLAEQFAA